MKRAWLAILICAVVLTLTACGGQADIPAPTAEPVQPVDLDLTKLSGTVVYSQVFDMLAEPENYMGQRVKIKGTLNYYQDPETQKEYFAVLIADATACCQEGMEFVWAGEHTYPQDYPPLDSEITVTGTFGMYEEYGYPYIQLADAELTWEAV